MKWHPDKNMGAGQENAAKKFKKIAEAYDTLSNADKRAVYDRYGEEGLKAGGGGGRSAARFNQHDIDPNEIFAAFFGNQAGGRGGNTGGVRFQFGGNMGGGNMGGGGFNMQDIFAQQAGGRGGGGRQQKPQQMQQQLLVSLEDMYKGGFVQAKTAHVTMVQSPFGTQQSKTYKRSQVQITRGMKEDTKISGAGGSDSTGDAVLVIQAKAHPTFERSGNDLMYDFRLPITKLLSRGVLTIPVRLLNGSTKRVTINLSAHSVGDLFYPGIEEAVMGCGMPIQNTTDEFGDLVLRLAWIHKKTVHQSIKSVVGILQTLLYLFCGYVFLTGGNIFVMIWVVWMFNRATA